MDMRISSVYSTYSAQPGRNSTQASRTDRGREGADSISLSSQAGDYQAARNAVANAPDIRENLVDRIQDMLNSGTYHVSAQDVAASILRI